MVRPVLVAALASLAAAPTLAAQDKTLTDRAVRAGEAGFGFGGRAGFGLASCRIGDGWSWPSYVGLKGGSFGLQIGAQSADVVLIFVNENAPRTIATSSLDLGAAASVAAGPVGRDVSAATDYKAQAEIYSYSKSKGLFAGIKIAGTKWEIDYSANKKAYADVPEDRRGGNRASVRKLFATDGGSAPAIVRPFLQSLAKNVGAKKTS
jgi:hypothetical protein